MDDTPVMPDTPDTAPEPTADEARSWLRENLVNICLGVGLLVVVLRFLDPLSVVLAAGGLTFIIFIHELGHFAAAKLCNVRVEAFSIGFGPPLPFCAYKYGETTYKLCSIPLGGFVKMLGEGDGASDDTADTDPRSFKNQSVPERMLIISAGVIMNIILACVLFVIVYLHGLPETPATIASTEPAGTAWRHNIHSGTEILAIGGRDKPWFADLPPVVWATNKGDLVDLKLEYNGTVTDIKAEPLRDEGAPFPMLGIAPADSLVLAHGKSFDTPFRTDSAASQARDADGQPLFLPGDTLVEMSDPDRADRAVTPIKAGPDDKRGDVFVYHRRLARLAGEPVTFKVRRMNDPDSGLVAVTVPPAFRRETGLRMRMGSIVATRIGSPADVAKLQSKEGTTEGDRIVAVEYADGPGVTVLTADYDTKGPVTPGRTVKPLDPLKLPAELNRWADRTPGEKKVKLTLLRESPDDHSQKRITTDLPWDDVGRFDLSTTIKAGTPLAVNGLGLAYSVQAVVDAVAAGSPADAAKIEANDTVVGVKVKLKDAKGVVDDGRWETIRANQWAFMDELVQRVAPYEGQLRVKKRNGEEVEVAYSTVEDREAPLADRGLLLMPEQRIQQAQGIGEALQMGAYRTLRMVQSTYINLYAMVFGRVSAVQTMSGPITLARVSYILAGEDTWKLILMLALININLAVVNFLPVPLLDGGHMMFLIYEGLRGKPPPERVHVVLTYIGLFFVACLMLFTIGLDIYRLLKMWLRW